MKITMYELLGLVKDGKAPKEIRYNNDIYVYVEKYGDYRSEKTLLYLSNKTIRDNDYNRVLALNNKVEILEEEKKIPEKLDIRQEKNIKNNWKWKVYGKEHSYNISTPQKIIADKVNEICDYIKSKGDE